MVLGLPGGGNRCGDGGNGKLKREWEDPTLSPNETGMPLTSAPGDEKKTFPRSHQPGQDISKFKRYFIFAVYIVQTIYFLIQLIVGRYQGDCQRRSVSRRSMRGIEEG